MKKLAKVCTVLGFLGITVALLSIPVQQFYASKAQVVQQIELYDDATRELTGELGQPLGTPQNIVIFDSKALLSEKSPEGVGYLNQNYLNENKIYPLQMKTVDFFQQMTLWIAGGVGLLLLAVGLFLARKKTV